MNQPELTAITLRIMPRQDLETSIFVMAVGEVFSSCNARAASFESSSGKEALKKLL